ncbi:MAG: T9SS type A sorting domain-containing protein [Flavobacterium sp.]
MKQFYFSFFLVFAFCANAQVINFPDANFKAKLLQPNVAFDENENPLVIDVNNNGEIEVSEVQDIFYLNVSNANIADLTGISNFTGMMHLQCNNNLLTTLAIDHSINIMAINASHNALTSVDVNYYVDVELVDYSYNNLTSLSLGNAWFPETVNLSHNQLSSLTLSNANFVYFNVDYNNLTSIEFVGNVSFVGGGYGSFTHNQFTLLDISGAYFDNSFTLALGYNPSDTVVFSDGSQPNIAYSSNNAVFDLNNYYMGRSCDPESQGEIRIANCPNLTQLILKNGYNYTSYTCNEGGTVFQNESLDLRIQNCPNLNHICVDDPEQPYVQTAVNNLGLGSQVQVNSNCTSFALASETAMQEQFVISPVPARTVLQIQSAANLEIQRVQIYNNLGQIVQNELGNQHNIDVSRLAKGSYYIKILANDLTSVKQFLKE